MITIGGFKQIIESKAGGQAIDKIPNINSIIYQGIITVKSKIDVSSSKRLMPVLSPIYNGSYENTLPNDMAGNSFIDFIPNVISGTQSSERYNATKFLNNRNSNNTNISAVNNIDGIQSLLLNFSRNGDNNEYFYTPDNVENVTLLGNATNLFIDYQYGISGKGSLNVNLNGGTQTQNGFRYTLPNNTLYYINDNSQITDFLLYFYIPDTASLQNITNGILAVTIVLSNDNGDVFTYNQTKTVLEQNVQVGQNVYRFPLPNTDLKVLFANGFNKINFYFNGVTGLLPIKILSIVGSYGNLGDILYYSESLIKGEDGSRKNIPTLDTDILIVNSDEQLLILYETILIMVVDIKHTGANFDTSLYNQPNLEKLYEIYKQRYPSERKIIREKFYRTNQSNQSYNSGYDYGYGSGSGSSINNTR